MFILPLIASTFDIHLQDVFAFAVCLAAHERGNAASTSLSAVDLTSFCSHKAWRS
eukprot:m.104339 g.104339  ORF g.104339 m.104339 type:complete len:55 (+) comp13258_c0_seq4:633-797(+)